MGGCTRSTDADLPEKDRKKSVKKPEKATHKNHCDTEVQTNFDNKPYYIRAPELAELMEKGVNDQGGEIIPLDCSNQKVRDDAVKVSFDYKHLTNA